MISKNQIKEKIVEKFKLNNSGVVVNNGYLEDIKHNLIQGVSINDFTNDLDQGSGNELEGKFLAIYSSSALAVNHFASFKRNINKLKLLSFYNFEEIAFEKKLPTGLRGTPPNLDVGLFSKEYLIGIESKYLEHTQQKRASFSESYNKEQLPYLNDEWFGLMKKYNNESMYIDVVQLIKHSIGLINNKEDKNPILLYLFWEPENYRDFDVFVNHRNELDNFTKDMKKLNFNFQWLSYPDIWDYWDHDSELEQLSQKLRKRYSLEV